MEADSTQTLPPTPVRKTSSEAFEWFGVFIVIPPRRADFLATMPTLIGVAPEQSGLMKRHWMIPHFPRPVADLWRRSVDKT